MKTLAFLFLNLLIIALSAKLTLAQNSSPSLPTADGQSDTQVTLGTSSADTMPPPAASGFLTLSGLMGGQLYCDAVSFSAPSDPHLAYGCEASYEHNKLIYSVRYVAQTESVSWTNNSSYVFNSIENYHISPARSTSDVALLVGTSATIVKDLAFTVQGGLGLQTYHTRGATIMDSTIDKSGFLDYNISRTALYEEVITNALSLEMELGLRYTVVNGLSIGIQYVGSFGEDGKNTGQLLLSLGVRIPVL